jgi:2-polyprenyl-3-methyl-5-hydroxy-6-metoxy-1,4-benzoquinol methylase
LTKSFNYLDSLNSRLILKRLSNRQREYLENAMADANHCYKTIKPYLKKKKILEIGGGIHLLTKYLEYKNYNITSVEPGNFADYIDKLRKLLKNKLNIHTTTVEKYYTREKYDFIFSMNVLEHTQDIKKHIQSCMRLLKDKNSLLFIQCPNYTFPFEPHFYKWFIPFFPQITFKYLRKKSLIKILGKKEYKNIINNLNFDCTYAYINKLNLPIKFINPITDIFDRLDNDATFRLRLCNNFIVKMCYQLINFLKIKKLLFSVFPKFLCPYLIMEIRKKV